MAAPLQRADLAAGVNGVEESPCSGKGGSGDGTGQHFFNAFLDTGCPRQKGVSLPWSALLVPCTRPYQCACCGT